MKKMAYIYSIFEKLKHIERIYKYILELMSAHIVVDNGYLRKKGKLNKRNSGSSPGRNTNLISYTKPMVTP